MKNDDFKYYECCFVCPHGIPGHVTECCERTKEIPFEKGSFMYDLYVSLNGESISSIVDCELRINYASRYERDLESNIRQFWKEYEDSLTTGSLFD